MSTSPGSRPDDDLPIDLAQLARIRRGLGQSFASGAICPAAKNLRVVDAHGALRCCEYGPELSGSPPAQRATLDQVASAHGSGRLPAAHCAVCIRAAGSEGVHGQVPFVRDYGDVPVGSGAAAPAAAPTVLVVRVGAGPLAESALAHVRALAPGVRRVVIDGELAFAGPAIAQVLAELSPSGSPGADESGAGSAHAARVVVRLQVRGPLGEVEIADWFAGHVVEQIEFDLSDGDFDGLLRARRLAQQLSAHLVARFVPTPTGWFHLEEAARACAVDPVVPLRLRLDDRTGAQPLASVSLASVGFVRRVYASAWARLGADPRPASLDANALSDLLLALRERLKVAGRAVLAGGAGAAEGEVELPPLDHPWCTDRDRLPWWVQNALGMAVEAPVLAFARRELARADAQRAIERHDWFRVLLHRLAADLRMPEALLALREQYHEARARAALLPRDLAFGELVDLSPFGGPWADRLGLEKPRARRRPFALQKPVADAPSAEPDVTVLVPSYAHEAYVVEAVRSVLAQTHRAFVVHVVDDRSPDATVERARSIGDPRVEVRVNDENLGLGNSVLRALENVRTPFVALLNSDDLFHPERLRKCLAVLRQDPSAQLVATGLSLVDGDGGHITPANASLVLDGQMVFDWVHWYQQASPGKDLPSEQLFARLLECNFLATSSNLVARTEWLRAQKSSLASLKYCLDWQLFLQAALEGALRHLPEPLAAYRLHSSNTVWFRSGRRWAYYLEVNRVAATALQRFARSGRVDDEAGVLRVLDAIDSHLSRNRETDGYAMLLNSSVDSLRLDHFAAESEVVQEHVQKLNRAAEAVREACDRARAAPSAAEARQRAVRQLLGDLAAEQVRHERESRRWLQGYCESLEVRLRECWDARRELDEARVAAVARAVDAEDRVSSTEAERARLAAEAAVLQAQLVDAREALRELRDDNSALRRDAEALRVDRDGVRADVETLRAERETLRAERETLRAEIAASSDANAALAQDRAATAADRDRARADLALREVELRASVESARQLEAERVRLAGEIATLEHRVADETAHVARLRSEQVADRDRSAREQQEAAARLASVERARDELVRDLTARNEELTALRRSREFRAGNFLWNKLPLGYVSRRGKKWYRRMLDTKNRGLLWLSRLFTRKKQASGVAVVTACWQWPIYSHTFVYQEMLGLTHMGLDVRLFHWEQGDLGQLHKAFTYLADHRTVLQPVWENHVRDREHFEKTRPGRLKAFLERVAQATGRSVDDLEKEPIVLQGCTFARMAELAGARYLHSYFFYDQSFMAMQAAWLLGIPRGVSCYADHMLDDYPWKLVPLQVELSDVVVATSARIKRELSQKSGGKYDDKILVKPNGVDGARFPAVSRPPRKKGEPIEVVSISRIEPKKGLTHLVEAVALLKQRGIRVIAHVVGSKDLHSKGSAEYAEAFDRCIRENGVEDLVVQHGMVKQEDLAPILKRCRAFVAPYVELGSGDKDGIPTAMLEGLASGLPVVTTDSGSILEVVDDGVEGIVVKQRDSKAFAAALQRLCEDPGLEQRMSNAARSRFDREFDARVTEKRLHERVTALLARAEKAK